MFFYSITESEIINVLSNLKPTKSSGFDKISSFVIKQVVCYIVTPLRHIFNLSLSSGIVPGKLKIGKVVPVFKKGDPHSFNNYRPITLLPSFSKILEKLVYNRVLSHLNKHHLLFESQYGFRNNHSCDLALIELHDQLINNVNNNLHSLGIFLDLSKAFDLVNHKILLSKLKYYGVRGIPLKWFENYLSNRVQFTTFNSANSSCSLINCGVPQG